MLIIIYNSILINLNIVIYNIKNVKLLKWLKIKEFICKYKYIYVI